MAAARPPRSRLGHRRVRALQRRDTSHGCDRHPQRSRPDCWRPSSTGRGRSCPGHAQRARRLRTPGRNAEQYLGCHWCRRGDHSPSDGGQRWAAHTPPRSQPGSPRRAHTTEMAVPDRDRRAARVHQHAHAGSLVGRARRVHDTSCAVGPASSLGDRSRRGVGEPEDGRLDADPGVAGAKRGLRTRAGRRGSPPYRGGRR